MKILAAGSCPDNSAALRFDNCNRWREPLLHFSPQRPLACSNYFVQLSVSFLFLSLEMRFESPSDSKNKLCHGPLLQCPCQPAKESYKLQVISDLSLTLQREEGMPGFACGKMPSRFWNGCSRAWPSRGRRPRLQITWASAITLRPRARPRDSPGLSFRRALPRFVAKGPDQFQTRPAW